MSEFGRTYLQTYSDISEFVQTDLQMYLDMSGWWTVSVGYRLGLYYLIDYSG